MSREFIYIHLTGPTASYRLPSAISGTQLALETPTYSAILGMLSYATGREITPNDTQIGFVYKYNGKSLDLETIHRWKRTKSGSLSYDDTNIRNREIHYNIDLKVILSNTDLIDEIKTLSRPLTFGRSQDLATIEEIKIVELSAVDEANLRGTLLPVEPSETIPANGMFYNLAEYFNYVKGKTRKTRNVRLFLALPQNLQTIKFQNIWQYQESDSVKYHFYLHEWM